MAYKVYVAVTLFVSESGFVTPQSIFFDGREYFVDKVVNRLRTTPKKVGGLLTERFDCMIAGKVKHLYLEASGRWFVEVDKNE